VRKGFKLPIHSAAFEIGLEELRQSVDTLKRYTPLSRFPKIEQDICLRVSNDTTYRQVYDFVWKTLQESHATEGHARDAFLATLSPLDIYQRPDDTAHKQITLRYTLQATSGH
jgi:phenylalanyl-tRNA synthetase beta subunit